MEEKDIREVLKITLERLRDKKPVWQLEGSANLMIQGLDVSIRDLDITTNEEGIEIFREALKDLITKDFYSDKIKGPSLICDINGFEVEINCYGDRDKNYFDEVRIINWGELEVPILPLECALEFYKSIGREEKVKLIEDYLKNKSDSI
ncbi:MAG: hypothetical protein WC494_03190 [Candidatus Pacearchaeota archaeon]